MGTPGHTTKLKAVIAALVFLGMGTLAHSAKDAPAGPFELWPEEPGATPTAYSKPAPPLPVQGLSWPKTKKPKGVPVTLKVDGAQTVAAITPYQFGCNAAWWDSKSWLLDPDRIEKAKQAGIRFWRFPGGSSSDNYHWNNDYSWHAKDKDGVDPSHMNQDWAVNTDSFIDFCKQTDSQAILTANYAAARYGSPQKAGKLAAEWVKYFKQKGLPVQYWEIGNECHGTWEEGHNLAGKPELTGAIYAKDLKVMASAIRKADKDLYIGADSVEVDDGGDWTGYKWWLRDSLPLLKDQADYLIFHTYFFWPYDNAKNPIPQTPEMLFGYMDKVRQGMDGFKAASQKYAGRTWPIAFTEYNLNEDVTGTIVLTNALFSAEVLGESIKWGYKAVNIWDWKNGYDAKNGGGDHGMLSQGDPTVPDNTPRPTYYTYALYSQSFGDKMVGAESSDPQVKVYASRFSGGEGGFVVVNQSTEPKQAVIEISGFQAKGQVQAWIVTGPGLDSKKITWNGVEGPAGGGGPFPIQPLPTYRMSFDPGKTLAVTLPPASVCGLVVY